MSEAPKRIWVAPMIDFDTLEPMWGEDASAGMESDGSPHEIPYLRADIADDLLEALEGSCEELEQAILSQIAAKNFVLARLTEVALDDSRAAIAKAKGTVK